MNSVPVFKYCSARDTSLQGHFEPVVPPYPTSPQNWWHGCSGRVLEKWVDIRMSSQGPKGSLSPFAQNPPTFTLFPDFLGAVWLWVEPFLDLYPYILCVDAENIQHSVWAIFSSKKNLPLRMSVGGDPRPEKS